MSKLLITVVVFAIVFIPLYKLMSKLVPAIQRMVSGASPNDIEQAKKTEEDALRKIREERAEVERRRQELEMLEKQLDDKKDEKDNGQEN
jgi:Mg2+/Co2+ transporter CorB